MNSIAQIIPQTRRVAVELAAELYDLKTTPCVRSGFCCKNVPCAYGEPVPGERACRFLETERDLGGGVTQYRCGRYDWIRENVEGWEWYPAFGAGCGSALFNEPREYVLDKLREKGEWTDQLSGLERFMRSIEAAR
jgi:hypothetical protein